MKEADGSHFRRRGLRLAGLAAAAAVVVLLPSLDLALSSSFYRAGEGFFLSAKAPLLIVYYGTRWYIAAVILGLLCSLVYSWLPSTKWDHTWRGRIAFLTLSLAMGPGLITHTLLKDHWGRPRPEQITNFGGTAHYVPPYEPSTQCGHNCSFPSGHAAAGFWLISGAWIWSHRRRLWILTGLSLGAVIGLTRIAQGGHFLSDVLAALAVVWVVNHSLASWMIKRSWLQPVVSIRAAG